MNRDILQFNQNSDDDDDEWDDIDGIGVDERDYAFVFDEKGNLKSLIMPEVLPEELPESVQAIFDLLGIESDEDCDNYQ